jgi:hypothetical protein
VNDLAQGGSIHHAECVLGKITSVLVMAALVVSVWGLRPGANADAATDAGPRYAPNGNLAFPAGYRTWVFLSSGTDMSYAKGAASSNMHMFENVFVNAEAYRGFLKTGSWPDKTTLVTEFRTAQSTGSINRSGRFQTDVMGFDVHVKDVRRFAGGWAFFGFGPAGTTSPMIPPSASCYRCHSQHAAVDTTFVQFYPTLLPIAKRKATLSHAYLTDETGLATAAGASGF